MSRIRSTFTQMPKVEDRTSCFIELHIPITAHQYQVMQSNYCLEEALMENVSRRIMSYMYVYIYTHTE